MTSKKLHAEERLIADVKSHWDSSVGSREETSKGAVLPKAVLVIKVSRSPCPRCADSLGELRSWGKSHKGWDLRVEVKSIGLYHGKAETESEDGQKSSR